jgi:hypothetical protein
MANSDKDEFLDFVERDRPDRLPLLKKLIDEIEHTIPNSVLSYRKNKGHNREHFNFTVVLAGRLFEDRTVVISSNEYIVRLEGKFLIKGSQKRISPFAGDGEEARQLRLELGQRFQAIHPSIDNDFSTRLLNGGSPKFGLGILEGEDARTKFLDALQWMVSVYQRVEKAF